MKAVNLAEQGFIPTWLIRAGIRMRLKDKLETESMKGEVHQRLLLEALKQSPLAIATSDANLQHYEVPTSFYQYILGERMKYSACYWENGVDTLDAAEDASLQLVAERAELANGLSVLELGCGWGSFSLWAAAQYPDSTFLAVSNSSTQAAYIRDKAQERGISNLQVLTEDMVNFSPEQSFDRIVSIEMFEHMRNHQELFRRIAQWLNDDGRLFVHVFSHKKYTYLYDSQDPDDWVSNYFFTGGIMPAHDLFSNYDEDLVIEEAWKLNGSHYSKTLEAWLDKLNENEDQIHSIFNEHYGKQVCRQWINRWRMFLLACSELFAYENGEQWGVSHYRFVKKGK